MIVAALARRSVCLMRCCSLTTVRCSQACQLFSLQRCPELCEINDWVCKAKPFKYQCLRQR